MDQVTLEAFLLVLAMLFVARAFGCLPGFRPGIPEFEMPVSAAFMNAFATKNEVAVGVRSGPCPLRRTTYPQSRAQGTRDATLRGCLTGVDCACAVPTLVCRHLHASPRSAGRRFLHEDDYRDHPAG